jgi:Fur family transcriptional regulator, ferric uptake regulator
LLRLIRRSVGVGSIGGWHHQDGVRVSARRRDHPHEHREPAGPASLRSRGRRLTRQRRLIWEALVAEPEVHLSADELVERVRERLPHVNPSTVYRTLELLVDDGLVLRTDLGAGRAFYEPAREHRHHHVVCERCGAVAHVHDEELGTLKRRVETASGYRLGNAEITFFGLCSACK